MTADPRVLQLEQSVRRMRLLSIVAVSASVLSLASNFVASPLVAQQRPAQKPKELVVDRLSASEIVAYKVTVVDADAKPRIELETDDKTAAARLKVTGPDGIAATIDAQRSGTFFSTSREAPNGGTVYSKIGLSHGTNLPVMAQLHLEAMNSGYIQGFVGDGLDAELSGVAKGKKFKLP